MLKDLYERKFYWLNFLTRKFFMFAKMLEVLSEILVGTSIQLEIFVASTENLNFAFFILIKFYQLRKFV